MSIRPVCVTAMKMTPRKISLDVGGTFVKCSDGRKVPVDSDGSREAIAAALREAVGPLEGLESVGVCIPGPFDYREGIFLMKHKFAAVYGERFADLVQGPAAIFHFIHDVNAPLQGLLRMHPELRQGRVALVTLGTGLGFSYAIDGEIQMNENLSPAVSLYNRPYKDGVLEDYVSRRALLRYYGKPLEGDVREMSERARAGEPKAAEAFLAAGRAFAEGAGPLLGELGISTVWFGGQIAKSFDLMRPAAEPLLEGILLRVAEDFEQAALQGVDGQRQRVRFRRRSLDKRAGVLNDDLAVLRHSRQGGPEAQQTGQQRRDKAFDQGIISFLYITA